MALIQRLIPVWAAGEGTEATGETVRQDEACFAEGPLWSEAVFWLAFLVPGGRVASLARWTRDWGLRGGWATAIS